MLKLVPQTIRIADVYEDGTHAKHFTFEPVNFTHQTPVAIGQFFMLSVPGAGQAPFTFASIPDETGKFNALIRNVGKLTHAVSQLKKGDLLGFNGPYGNGWPADHLLDKEVMIAAGGCGLAPLASTIEHIIENGRPDKLTLYYATHDRAGQVLKKELRRWESELLVIEIIHGMYHHHHAHLNYEFISQTLAENNRHPEIVFTCGPEGMMKSVAESSIQIGLKASDVWLSIERRMHCGVGLCGHCYIANTYACRQGPTYRYDQLMALEQKTAPVDPHQGKFKFC